MKIIDEAKSQGEKIISFESWCGGLPAPECADNPLRYKFSWSPRGVLLAALNDARYRLNNSNVQIPGARLLYSVFDRPFGSPLALEGIPNRDSLKYESLYGLQGISTMIRGTLRYEGFCQLMRAFKDMGLLSSSLNPSSPNTWSEFTKNIDISSIAQMAGIDRTRLEESLEWLGLSSSKEPFDPADSLLDSFCALLQRKLNYAPGERDMVVMQHEFVLQNQNGQMRKLSSSLIEYGEIEGFSAMARTVGYPVAVAAEMILNESITRRGVLAPVFPEIYDPMLKTLESTAGIRFRESIKKLNSRP